MAGDGPNFNGNGKEELMTACDFTTKFLGHRVNESKDALVKDIDTAIKNISLIFRDITTCVLRGNVDAKSANELLQGKHQRGALAITDIGRAIYSIIEESANDREKERLLLIKSPLGSYKNRLLKYIYLKVATGQLKDNFLPFYIDMTHYEENREDFAADVETIKKIIDKQKLIPLFIIDNVRTFACGINDLYMEFYNEIERWHVSYKLVVGADYRFKDAPDEEADEQPSDLVEKELTKYCMFIDPIRLDNEVKSVSFIKNCIDVFKPEIESFRYCETDPVTIYKSLKRIDLVYIDAYWLVRLLAVHSLLIDEANNIVDIYDTIIKKVLPLDEDIRYAAAIAYDFFCNNKFQKVVNPDRTENPAKTIKIWQVIRKHKSVLDYLVAKHYTELLRNLQFDQPKETLKAYLEFFNRVFPKNITRFAARMIEGDEDLEEKILNLAENEYYYDILDVTGQSELTYWLGRLSDDSQEKAFDILKKLKEKAKVACLENENKDVKTNNFLLRGIYVSLLYCRNVNNDNVFHADKMRILNEYIKLLFSDKVADEVNRAFHLEYYNDISYKLRPKSNDLIKQMKDNLAVGRNTFHKLTSDLDLENRTDRKEYDSVNVLQLVTFCSLLLARKPEKIDRDENSGKDGKKYYYVKKIIENYSGFETKDEYIKIYDIYDDLVKCISFMNTLATCPIYRELDKQVVIYLNWTKSELEWLKDEFDRAKVKEGAYFIPFIETRTYNLFSRTTNVLRTGWLQRCVGRAESVAEHTYNCWFMGLLYLPETGTEAEQNEGYSKAAVLSMLLIHDLGEVITGDIPRDIKMATPETKQKYDEEENLAMYSMLLTGAYPFVNSTMHEYYDVWDAWVNLKSKRNINAEIAKDIDNIQAVYKYCQYYLNRASIDKTNRGESLTIFNGNNKPVLRGVDFVDMTKQDCLRWLSTVDPDKENKDCILLNGRSKEISQKVIFENLEFRDLIISYKKSKKA